MGVIEKVLDVFKWITGKIDEKEQDDERHTLSRLRDAEREADEGDDTSGIESIIRE